MEYNAQIEDIFYCFSKNETSIFGGHGPKRISVLDADSDLEIYDQKAIIEEIKRRIRILYETMNEQSIQLVRYKF